MKDNRNIWWIIAGSLVAGVIIAFGWFQNDTQVSAYIDALVAPKV